MKKLWLLVAIVALAAAIFLYIKWDRSPQPDKVKMQPAKIADIRKMAELCTMDFYEDLPVKASIGNRHIFAKVTVTGSISFNLDSLKVDDRNDTLFVSLPTEKIDVYESTAPGSYQVIDTWNDKFLGSTTFTTSEENRIKTKVIENFKKSVYRRGYVRTARIEARRNLADMLHAVTGKTVVVK